MLLNSVLALALSIEPSEVVRAKDAPRYAVAEDKGEVSLLLQREVAVSRLTLQPGARVGEHTHESSETLVVLEGTCTLTLRGVTHQLVAGDTVYIGKGDKHAAAVPADAKGPFVAVQVYSPAGPEQRFTKGKKL
jgi:quercetin dioxygenase-like cupin family protein